MWSTMTWSWVGVHKTFAEYMTTILTASGHVTVVHHRWWGRSLPTPLMNDSCWVLICCFKKWSSIAMKRSGWSCKRCFCNLKDSKKLSTILNMTVLYWSTCYYSTKCSVPPPPPLHEHAILIHPNKQLAGKKIWFEILVKYFHNIVPTLIDRFYTYKSVHHTILW